MGHTSELDLFLNRHKDQLLSSGVPQIYWKTLSEKIHNQIFDAGETFQLMKIHYDEERERHEPVWALQITSNVGRSDPKHIYLIDHCWTFRVGHAKNQLLQVDSLRTRLSNILGLDENQATEELVSEVMTHIWKVCRTYSIQSAQEIEDRLPVWYVMDEIGSAVMHSDTPNFRVVPFLDVGSQITYSLLFPIKDVMEEDFVFVDFAEGVKNEDERSAALLPWVPKNFEGMSFKPEMPGPDYYLGGHIKETLPDTTKLCDLIKNVYKVFTEYDLVEQYLKHSRFKMVDNKNEADILWLTQHFKDFARLSETPDKFVNQFPFEYVITVKDLLSLTCRKFLKPEETSLEFLKWCPITYNLKTEIGNFVGYFQHRESEGLDNYWIIKPYNLARSLDIHITNNLSYIMRLPATGPKIAQKYISKPVLFFRPECNGLVKFDIRYVLLLKSVKPVKAYVYKEFFLRFANKPFELNDFDDYEKHFTVMNYKESVTLKHMLCEEFITKWEEQYPNHGWKNIEKSITDMLKNVLECAAKDEPPCGIAHSPQSRAVYAADIMLEWNNAEMQPKLLEINWTPDCKRACEYYPSFYNDIFRVLFLNELTENIIEI